MQAGHGKKGKCEHKVGGGWEKTFSNGFFREQCVLGAKYLPHRH